MEKIKNEFYVVSVEDTIKYGIIKAAIIGRVKWWCKYNEDNKVKDRFHNGEWWSGFMKPKEFAEQLGMPETTIKNNLVMLMKDEILIKGNFNKRGFDKTNWYRVNPNPPQIQSSYRKDTTIVSERYNDSIGEVQSVVSDRYEHSIGEGEPIPVNPSVNTSVNQKLSNIPVSTPVNPSVEEYECNTDLVEEEFEYECNEELFQPEHSLEEQLAQINIELDLIKDSSTDEDNERRGQLMRQQFEINKQLKELV